MICPFLALNQIFDVKIIGYKTFQINSAENAMNALTKLPVSERGKKIFDKGYFIVLALHDRLLKVMSKIVRGKIPGIVSIISS